MERNVEIIRHRGRRYRRRSPGCDSSGSSSASSACSATESIRGTCLPPLSTKCRDSFTVKPFQHQKHKPLPSIGATMDSTNTSSVDGSSQSVLHLSSPVISCDSWRDSLLHEPDPSDPNTVLLKLKLPNNSSVQRRFNYTRDCICHVIIFAHFSLHNEPLNFDLVTLSDNSVPKHNYLDFSLRLDQVGLTHNTLLHYSYES